MSTVDVVGQKQFAASLAECGEALLISRKMSGRTHGYSAGSPTLHAAIASVRHQLVYRDCRFRREANIGHARVKHGIQSQRNHGKSR